MFFFIHCKSSFPTIFTPQGDGNLPCGQHCLETIFLHSRQYLPRKGTETERSKGFAKRGIAAIIPDNIYPARGRKRAIALLSGSFSMYSRQYLPRKGTETFLLHGSYARKSKQYSRQYLPRKGTETDANDASLP